MALNFEICRPGGDLYVELVDKLDAIFHDYVRNIQSEIPFLGSVEDTNYRNSLMDLKGQLLRLSLWLRWPTPGIDRARPLPSRPHRACPGGAKIALMQLLTNRKSTTENVSSADCTVHRGIIIRGRL